MAGTAYLVIDLASQSNGNGFGMQGQTPSTALPASYPAASGGRNLQSTSDILYTGAVKIWNDGTNAFQNLSQSTYVSGNSLGLGPQLFIGANMLMKPDGSARWPAGDCYICKYSQDASRLDANTVVNWSLEDYSDSTKGLTRLGLIEIVAAINWLLNPAGGNYDTVEIPFWLMCQGESSAQFGIATYFYRKDLNNLHARVRERLNLTWDTMPLFIWSQPVIPRDTTVGTAQNYYNEPGHFIRSQAVLVMQGINARLTPGVAARAIVTDTSTIYASGDILAGDDRHWACQGQQKRITAVFADYDTRVVAGYTNTALTASWTEDTSLPALPTFSITAAPATTYSPGAAITATAGSAANFDAGHSIGNVVWSCTDDPSISGSGSSFSAVPRKYNGLNIQAVYVNGQGYMAMQFAFTHVLAPRDKITTHLGTPKQWLRGCMDMVYDSESYEVTRALNYSAGNQGYAWQAWDGSTLACRRMHKGVAVARKDQMRLGTWDGSSLSVTTANMTAASLDDATDHVRFIRFRPRAASAATTLTVLGARNTTTTGMSIAIMPTGGASSETNIKLIVRRGSGTDLVPASGLSGLVINPGDDVVCAARRSGNNFTFHALLQDGSVYHSSPVAYTGMTADAVPDSIGWTSDGGFEGLVLEAIGAQVAPTDTQIGEILQQMGMTEIASASQNASIGAFTQSVTASVTAAGSSVTMNASIGEFRHASETGWVELRDTAGNRRVQSLPVQRAAVEVTTSTAHSASMDASIGTFTQVVEADNRAAGSQSASIGAFTQSVTAAVSSAGTALATMNASIGEFRHASETGWVELRDSTGNRRVQSLPVQRAAVAVSESTSHNATQNASIGNFTQSVTAAVSNAGAALVTMNASIGNFTHATETGWVELRDGSGNRRVQSLPVQRAAVEVTTVDRSASMNASIGNFSLSAQAVVGYGGMTTMIAPFDFGPGSLFYPPAWIGSEPVSGVDKVYFETHGGFTINPNGTISATAPTGTWKFLYQDASGFYEGEITLDQIAAATQNASIGEFTQNVEAGSRVSGGQSASIGTFTLSETAKAAAAAQQSASIGEFSQTVTAASSAAGTALMVQNASIGEFTQAVTGKAAAGAAENASIGTFQQVASGTVAVGAQQSATILPFTQSVTATSRSAAQQNAAIGNFTQTVTAATSAAGTALLTQNASIGAFSLSVSGQAAAGAIENASIGNFTQTVSVSVPQAGVSAVQNASIGEFELAAAAQQGAGWRFIEANGSIGNFTQAVGVDLGADAVQAANLGLFTQTVRVVNPDNVGPPRPLKVFRIRYVGRTLRVRAA